VAWNYFRQSRNRRTIILSADPLLYGRGIFTPDAVLSAKSGQVDLAVMNISWRRHKPVSPRTDPYAELRIFKPGMAASRPPGLITE
jgi:hypothetical protein